MMSEAIVTDVSEEADEVVMSPREALVQEIVEDNLDVRAEIEGVGPEYTEEEPIQDEPIEEDDTITLQVMGKEVVVPRSEVEEAGVRTLQKETAADSKLELAASRERELNQRELDLKAMEDDLLRKQMPVDVEPNEVGKAFADALFEDETVVANTISNITKTQANMAKEVLALKAERELIARERADKEVAEKNGVIKHYHDSYSDISTDPDMHNSLNMRLATVAKENPELTPQEVVDEAASQVYERFGVNTNPHSEAKRNMIKQPKRAAGRKVAVKEPKPKTRSDTIDGMRKLRGVQPY